MDVDDLLAMIPASISSEPGAREALEGMLRPVARVQSFHEARRGRLHELRNPRLVPDAAVRFLAAIVGMGDDLSTAFDLTDDERRRMITAAVRLWKIKGTSDSYRNVVKALTGQRSILFDWFKLRLVFDAWEQAVLMPDPGSEDGYPYAHPETVVDMWIDDPQLALDYSRIARWLGVVRPLNERINVRRAMFLDDLMAGKACWRVEGDGALRYDGEALELACVNGRKAFADVGDEATWGDYRAFVRLAVDEGEGELYVLATGADDGYRIRIDPAASAIRLARVVGGTATTLEVVTQATAFGTAYQWSLDTWLVTGGTQVQLWLEGTLVLDYTDTDAARFDAGALGWGSQGAGDRATLTTAIVSAHNETMVRVGPTT